MRVTIRDAAALLGTSEDKIYDWIETRNFPAHKINGEFRINRSELLEWATAEKLSIAPALFREIEKEEPVPDITSALRSGGIFYGIRGSTREEILRSIVQGLQFLSPEEREVLLQMFLAREALGATGIGDGIAIPHVRNPIVLSTDQSVLSLYFIEPSSDFTVLDDQPVFALFVLICPTIHVHLQMLAKLAYLLRLSEFRDRIRAIAPADDILETAERLERTK